MQSSDKESNKKKFESKYYEKESLWDISNTEVDKERINRVLELIPKESESLLDVGCGNGILCNLAKQKLSFLKRVVGFDRSHEAIKYVKTEKKIGEINDLPFKNEEFDVVCALEVLEHLDFEIFELALKEISRVVKKRIIITVPYNENLENNMTICKKCKQVFNRNYHIRSFDSKNLQNLFLNWGFHLSLIQPIGKKKEKLLRENFIMFWNIIHGKDRHFHRQEMKQSVCPFCGFHEEEYKNRLEGRKRSKFRNILNQFWPKRETYIWFLSIYEKK